jgi:hypothetical protein
VEAATGASASEARATPWTNPLSCCPPCLVFLSAGIAPQSVIQLAWRSHLSMCDITHHNCVTSAKSASACNASWRNRTHSSCYFAKVGRQHAAAASRRPPALQRCAARCVTRSAASTLLLLAFLQARQQQQWPASKEGSGVPVPGAGASPPTKASCLDFEKDRPPANGKPAGQSNQAGTAKGRGRKGRTRCANVQVCRQRALANSKQGS